MPHVWIAVNSAGQLSFGSTMTPTRKPTGYRQLRADPTWEIMHVSDMFDVSKAISGNWVYAVCEILRNHVATGRVVKWQDAVPHIPVACDLVSEAIDGFEATYDDKGREHYKVFFEQNARKLCPDNRNAANRETTGVTVSELRRAFTRCINVANDPAEIIRISRFCLAQLPT